jgi:hypothetical protein
MKRIMFLAFSIVLSLVLLSESTQADFIRNLSYKVVYCDFADFESSNDEGNIGTFYVMYNNVQFVGFALEQVEMYEDSLFTFCYTGIFFNKDFSDVSQIDRNNFLEKFNPMIQGNGFFLDFVNDKLALIYYYLMPLKDVDNRVFCYNNLYMSRIVYIIQDEMNQDRGFGVASGGDDSFSKGIERVKKEMGLSKPEFKIPDKIIKIK